MYVPPPPSTLVTYRFASRCENIVFSLIGILYPEGFDSSEGDVLVRFQQMVCVFWL